MAPREAAVERTTLNWEVALQGSLGSREVLWGNVPTQDLGLAFEKAQARVREGQYVGLRKPVVLITREDWTPEARLQRYDEEMYDRDRRGYRRRRFRKPASQREWEVYCEATRKAGRVKKRPASIMECKECGVKWHSRAYTTYAMKHDCEKGLVYE